MSPPTSTERVALCVAEYRQLLESGDPPPPDAFRDRLGDAYPQFLSALTETLDELIAPARPAAETFPRAFGSFLLLGRLGSGGMGVVYDALHRALGRRVAVKVLHARIAENDTARERFKREAQACAQIRHPNVVEIYDAGEVDGFAYYSMALLEGTPLDRLQPDERPPIDALLRGLASIADALDHMHRDGVIHRDVKPSNIVMRDDGSMVLADFGLAKMLRSAELTASGSALGTPLYASPEQLRGDTSKTDARTDVYSLGATVYEIVAGVPPLRAEDVGGLIQMVLHERPPALPPDLPGVPQNLNRVVQTALEKDPDDRYATAAALRDDLLALVDGGQVRGRPLSEVRRALRTLWRHRWTLSALVTIAIGLSLWRLTRPATLRVTSFPPAAVHIDDVRRGMTPLELELGAGTHRLRIGRPGFGEYESVVDLSVGGERDVHQVLIVGESDAFEAICCLADALGISMVNDLDTAPAEAAQGAADNFALLPGGDVRLDDLTDWWISGEPVDGPAGRIAFNRDGEEIFAKQIVLSGGSAQGAIPDVVLKAVRPGEVVTWGWYPSNGTPRLTTFRMTELDVGGELRDIEERLRDQPRSVVRHLKAEVLLSRGLALSAFFEAGRIDGSGACEERAQEIRRTALRRLGVRMSTDRHPLEGRSSDGAPTGVDDS